MNDNNLFIQLLKRIFASNDGKPLADILTKGKTNPISKVETSVNNQDITQESLKEDYYDMSDDLAALGYTPEAENQLNIEQRNQQTNQISSDSKQEEPEIISGDQAKLFNMSPRDLFMVLYNGYLDHAYDGQDLYDIDNDPSDHIKIKGSNGKDIYELSKSISNLFNKCYNNDNAFTYKDETGNSYNKPNQNTRRTGYREVQDIKDKILQLSRKGMLSKEDRAELISEISSHTTR